MPHQIGVPATAHRVAVVAADAVQPGAVDRLGVDAGGEAPTAGYDTVRGELEAYGAGLEDKLELVVLSKSDTATPQKIAAVSRAIERRTGVPPLVASAMTGEGMDAVLGAVLAELRPASKPADSEGRWSPL